MSAALQVACAAYITRPDERARVAAIAAAVERADTAGQGRITATLMNEARAIGVGYGTLRRHYDAWLRAGKDATALADRRKQRPQSAENRWLQVYMRYCENDKNTSANAWRTMMQDFRAGACADGAPYGEVFSGIGTWREAWARENPYASGVPDAWPSGWIPLGASQSNLQRAARANPDYLFQIAASRQGRKAAHRYLLDVIKTRLGLPVGAIRQWDDVWHNTDVRLPAFAEVVQPLEFAGYDVASAFKCDSVIKPRITRADGKRDNLKEQTFRFLFAYSNCVTGFNKNGITHVVEWGTAAIREPVERQIKLIPVYGDLIRFQRSGILSEQVHAGLFVGGGAGNFRIKPLVEASHRVTQNRVAGLIGDRGRDAEHTHESRAALVKYEERLAIAAASLPADLAAKIEYGLLSFDEYCAAFRAVERALMADSMHTLEGWDSRQVSEYSPVSPPCDSPSTWRPAAELLDMAPDDARALAGYLKAHPECVRTRWMSRAEAWEAGRITLARVPLMEMPAFLDDRDMIELPVKENGTIAFANYYYYGRDRMIYRADAIKTPDGYVRRLAPGQKIMLKYNPLVPEHVWVIDRENGATVGMAPAHSRVPMECRAEIETAMGLQAHDLARKIRPVRGRHQPEAVARAGRMARNQAALLGLAQELPVDGSVIAPADGAAGQEPEAPRPNAIDYFAEEVSAV